MPRYTNISMKKEFANEIDKFIKNNPQLGFRSISQFLEHAARKRLEELGGLPPTLSLMDINVEEGGNRVVIWDSNKRQSVEVTFTSQQIKCSMCGPDSCEHVRFALSLPPVQEELEKRRKLGMKIPEAK